jgi:hypothetical protein
LLPHNEHLVSPQITFNVWQCLAQQFSYQPPKHSQPAATSQLAKAKVCISALLHALAALGHELDESTQPLEPDSDNHVTLAGV